MEILNRFRRQRKDDDRLGQIKKLPQYKSLLNKFGTESLNVKAGLEKDSLTVGDVVDILVVYLTAAESGTRGVYRTIAELAKQGGNYSKETESEIDKLYSVLTRPEDLDRQSPLYSYTVDLSKVIHQASNTYELSHYPGGIVIKAEMGEHLEPTGKYILLLTNRQDSDRGKPTHQILEEVGLPIKG